MSRLNLSDDLFNKYNRLQNSIKGMCRAIIAFSGGVDSSLVAFVTNQELGENALAVTSGSRSIKRSDLQLTKDLAKKWGLNHRVVFTDELSKSKYQANPINRCFYCKASLYSTLSEIASNEDYPVILNGTNVDDLSDHRPGLMVAEDFKVRSPLVEAEFYKQDIRKLARYLGMENAEKPQAACLASRVPYGSGITEDILNQIEQAENVLADLGFTQFRVRHHGEVARIELIPSEMHRALDIGEQLQFKIRACGYRFISLDLSGFRSGSLNEGVIEAVHLES